MEIHTLLDNSIIILDKPCGHICHDVTSQVKRILGVSRTGHAGTLDPDVSGVFACCTRKGNETASLYRGKG